MKVKNIGLGQSTFRLSTNLSDQGFVPALLDV